MSDYQLKNITGRENSSRVISPEFWGFLCCSDGYGQAEQSSPAEQGNRTFHSLPSANALLEAVFPCHHRSMPRRGETGVSSSTFQCWGGCQVESRHTLYDCYLLGQGRWKWGERRTGSSDSAHKCQKGNSALWLAELTARC